MRPAVDFHSRYSKQLNKASAAFPDQTEIWNPVVELVLRQGKKHFRAFGLLDSGSQWTFIAPKYASPLGIDWRLAPTMTFAGLGNPNNIGYAVDLKLVLVAPNFAWDAKVVVTEAIEPFPMILLGHQGFFENFDVTFQTRLRHFHIQRK